MSINSILSSRIASIESMVYGQVEASPEEMYLELQAAVEDLNVLQKESTSLEEHIETIFDVEAAVDEIHESGEYDQQTLELHAKAINDIKEKIGDAPIDIAISTESLTHMSALATQISLESKGLLSRAWDAVLALINSIWEKMKAIGRFLNPWRKSRDEAVKEGLTVSNDDSAELKKITEASGKAAKENLDKMVALQKIGVPEKEDADKVAAVINNDYDDAEKYDKVLMSFSDAMATDNAVIDLDNSTEITGNSFWVLIPKNDDVHDKALKVAEDGIATLNNAAKSGKGDPKVIQQLANAFAAGTNKTVELERKDAKIGKKVINKGRKSRKNKTQGKKK